MESKVNQVPPNLSRGLLQSVELHHYILNTSVFPRESEFLRELRAATASHPAAVMGTSPDEGPLIEMLLKMINAKKTIELGVFTGYSLLLTALSIPDDGKILAIDIDREAFNIGLPIIKKAGVEEKVEFVQSEAIPVLDRLLENNENEGSFDFAFVDADKINYWNYHERLMKLVRIGGIVVYDNTLWGGTVVMPREAILIERRRSSWACTLDFNNRIASDSRVHICLAPFGDGVTICRRI